MKALIVGINYRGTRSALRGCINDAKNMMSMLIERGVLEENITLLTDDTPVKPTRANIAHHLKELVASGTDLFFHYSGHGTSVRDHNGDEPDRKDEALCPIDYERAGFITDDEIREILLKLPSGAKMTCILDCCHSGTGCDLAYNLRGRGRKGKRRLQFVKEGRYADTPANIVMLSGCMDHQTSADAYLGGRFQGALTASVLYALRFAGVKNWEQLFTVVRKHLKQVRFRQVPNLSSGRPIHPKTPLYF